MLIDMGTSMLNFFCPLEIRIEVVSCKLACRIHLSVTDNTSLTTFIAELQKNRCARRAV